MISRSLKETKKTAKDFFKNLPEISQKALVIGLYGDLGSGKTTFLQFFGKEAGIKESITSPTFVIEKIFDVNFKGYKHLIHIDAYRLDSSRELLSLGWKEISSDPANVIFIEWAEKVKDILPKNHMRINFRFISENEREIDVDLTKKMKIV